MWWMPADQYHKSDVVRLSSYDVVWLMLYDWIHKIDEMSVMLCADSYISAMDVIDDIIWLIA